MSDETIKIDELRACFDRESNRKDSLQNKASYFLGIISVITTIICTFFSIFKPHIVLNSYLNIILIVLLCLSFLISIIFCLKIFIPRKYAHPFEFENYNCFKNSFKNDDSSFKKELFHQYLISTYTNHNLNDELVSKINIAIISFICFIILFLMVVVSNGMF